MAGIAGVLYRSVLQGEAALVYYALTIFLSAFLLFQVQPLISKRILPWFGGTPTVWTTCMLFFQVALLLGYLYAHVVGTRLRVKWQVVAHGVVMAAALCFLPIYASAAWKPDDPSQPTWRIILLLSATVGLPYFVLATTSPLVQKWFTLARPDAKVYRLYALSNAGSLLALVTYPSAVEPTLTGRWQAYVWSGGFGLFVILCGYSAYLAWRARPPEETQEAPRSRKMGTVPTEQNEGDSPHFFKRVMWLLLAACASTMLLAVTNQICLDIAVVPFLWVLPLGLYLLSFIICFDNERWYYRPVFWPLMIVMCGLMSWYIYRGAAASIAGQIGVFSLGLFACCMVCHGELVRLKPSPRYLTTFYLMVAAGGALGGIFVALIAPHVFLTYTELNVGIAGAFGVAATALLYDLWRRSRQGKSVPLFFAGTVAVTCLVALTASLATIALISVEDYVYVGRNFYGVLRIQEYYPNFPELRKFTLLHGRIEHGWQFTAPDKRRAATSYFGEQSGVGLMLRHFPRRSPMRVGILGLGAGSLAVYGQPGDHYTFYEINPIVAELARTWFKYLDESHATRCDIVMGDGRLSLEREVRQGTADKFDVLILDAFSGDALPTHLLTCEAFEVYRARLKDDGVIAVNVSNRHFDLCPVVWGIAKRFNLKTAAIYSLGDTMEITSAANWILLSADERTLSQEAIARAVNIQENRDKAFVWTDDFSNLFRIVNWRSNPPDLTPGQRRTHAGRE